MNIEILDKKNSNVIKISELCFAVIYFFGIQTQNVNKMSAGLDNLKSEDSQVNTVDCGDG